MEQPSLSPVVHALPSTAASSEPLEDVPAVTMDLPPSRRPWDNDDDALVATLEKEGGNAVVAFKLPSSRRARSANGRRAALPSAAFDEGLRFLESQGAEIVYVYRSIGAAWARLPASLGPEIRRNPLVDYVEPQQWAALAGVRANGDAVAEMRRSMLAQTTPWGMSLIRAPLAWNVTTGAGVKVLIIDNGVSTHEDLPTIPSQNCNGVFGGCDDGPFFHGTHVTGIVLARNNTKGVVGVAPGIAGTTVYEYGACDSNPPNGCSTVQIAAGIDWGRSKGVKVINMSLSGPYDAAIANAVAQAWQTQSIVLVASAGNLTHIQNPQTVYPAGHANVIGVSGVKSDGNFASTSPCSDGIGGSVRSNWDASVDLSAPFWALSTVGTASYEDESDDWCGTSMAAPHVSGAAALIFALHPTWTNTAVVNLLFSSAQDRGTWGRDDLYGFGIVDAAAAVGWSPPVLSIGISGPAQVRSGSTCQWTANVIGGTPPYSYDWTVGGNVSHGASVTYTNGGSSFTIRLQVTDAGSQVDNASKAVTISGSAPICQF